MQYHRIQLSRFTGRGFLMSDIFLLVNEGRICFNYYEEFRHNIWMDYLL
jgi:hypothetical protein